MYTCTVQLLWTKKTMLFIGMLSRAYHITFFPVYKQIKYTISKRNRNRNWLERGKRITQCQSITGSDLKLCLVSTIHANIDTWMEKNDEKKVQTHTYTKYIQMKEPRNQYLREVWSSIDSFHWLGNFGNLNNKIWNFSLNVIGFVACCDGEVNRAQFLRCFTLKRT